MRLAAAILAATPLGLVLACGDPVHDTQVSALGPENPGTPNGPFHRPGQPCLTCHDGTGPASAKFSVAGTVYQTKALNSIALPGATVHLTDVNGSTRDETTNAAGNFFVPFSDWAPGAPIKVSIALGQVVANMGTHIGRDGSCASCHYDATGSATGASTTTPGHVYLVTDVSELPDAGP